MPARKRVKSRRMAVRSRRDRSARGLPRGRTARRELVEVLNAQVESGEELRNAKVPAVTEPAFVFRA